MSSKKAFKIKKDIIKKIAIAVIIILAVAFIGYQKFIAGKGSVAAYVNGDPIYKEEVLREYVKVPVEYRNTITVDSILEGMVVEMLILQEAEEMEIITSENEVNEYLAQLLVAYGLTEENLTQSLIENDITLEELKASFMKRITISKVLNKTVLSDLKVTDAEIQAYYDQNQGQFGTPAKIRASHILLNKSSEAESVRNKALGGADFAGLAEKYSIGPSASNGGNLGWFARGQMVKSFEDAAFALEKINKISEVVETQFGFHVIKLTGKESSSIPPLSEVRNTIGQALLSDKQTAAVDIYTSQLEAKSDIEIFMVSLKEPEGTPISELINQQQEERDSAEVETAPAEEAPAEEPQQTSQSSGAESLAECLASKGARMFGSDSSAISNEQKDLFGSDFSDIEYVDCSENKDECKQNSVISYPTWIIDGKKYPGKYSLERLAELAEC